MIQLSEKDFIVFQEEAKKWIEFWGLKDWEVFFKFEHCESLDRAQCWINWRGRICTLVLAKFQPEERTECDIRKMAFHESCELLLHDMEAIALDEEIPHEERKGLTESYRHAVIRRLENSIFIDG